MAIRRIRKPEANRPPPASKSTDARSAKRTDTQIEDEAQQSPAFAVPKKSNKPNTKKKHQPTGDYPIGYCRPPVEHQFNGKPGPGRPKGAVSQDKLLRKHLHQKRKARIDGKEINVSMRELLLITAMKQALSGKKELFFMLSEASRLFPAEKSSQLDSFESNALTPVDQQLMDVFFSKLGLDQPPTESSSPPGSGNGAD